MEYSRIWDNYQEFKKGHEGKCYSSVKSPYVTLNGLKKLSMTRVKRVFLEDRSRKKTITSLPELLNKIVPEAFFIISLEVDQVVIEGGKYTKVSEKSTKRIPANSREAIEELKKEIPEEAFMYLWEKAEGIWSGLSSELSILEPTTERGYVGGKDNLKIMEEAGFKVVPIPEDISPYIIHENPFIFRGRIMLTSDSKKFLETYLKHNPQWTAQIHQLLELWKN